MATAGFLRSIGAPAERYMRSGGLPVLCTDTDALVPLRKVWSFFDTAARHEDPTLGWLVGAHVGDHNLNAGLRRKLEGAPTLFQALHELVRLVGLEASDIHLGIRERRDDIMVFAHYPGMRGLPGFEVAQPYQLGVIIDLARHFLGRHWDPGEIGIETSRVPAVAQEYFPGSRILSDQATGYITVPRSCLHHAGPAARSNDGEAETPVPVKDLDYPDRLRAVLRSYLSERYLTEQIAANLMETSVRTLTRRLSEHNVRYGALIDELRFTTAKEQLRDTDQRIMDIAQSVGFEDQAHFTRMFRRIGGLSPREFRRAVWN